LVVANNMIDRNDRVGPGALGPADNIRLIFMSA
jgi:hypothetical protein